MNARWGRPAQFRSGTLWAIALLSLSSAACFRTLDVSKLHCRDNSGCPSNHYCANGSCVAGQTPVDGSNADLPVSPGLDGQAGVDGTQSKGGAGGSTVDGALGGAGGGTVDGALGGAGGSSTGGTSGGTGGTGPQDAPGGSGGTTFVPDAFIAPDGRDAPADLAIGINPGSVCSSATASECSSGFCVDSHCCNVASCGTCQSCTGPGGTCVAVTNAEDPDTCTGSSTCDTSGVCKKKTGQACSTGTECMGGNCADGVCCNSACNGSCEYCNGGTPGTCGYISGAPKVGHPACAGTGACQGTCNATKASCTFPGAETNCRQPSCNAASGVATNPAVCDGQGNCPALSTTNCTPYICGTTSCLTTCSSVSQCLSGLACVNSACQSCTSGQTICGNACVNLQGSDRNNCGACGRSCPCVNGVCMECTTLSDCATGYQNCTSNKCLCRPQSLTNSVPDAGFDTAANFSAIWHPDYYVTWSSVDADGCPGSGSLEIPPTDGGGGPVFSLACMGVGAANYTFGFKYNQSYPQAVYCFVDTFSDGSCTTATYSGFPPEIYTGDVTNSWASTYMSIPTGTYSISVSCFLLSPQVTVYLDEFYLNSGSNTY